MHGKTKTILIVILLLLLALGGAAIIIVPPYLQNQQLTQEAEEFIAQNSALKTSTPVPQATILITAEPADEEEPKPDVPVVTAKPLVLPEGWESTDETRAAEEQAMIEAAEKAQEETPTPEPTEWNPFGDTNAMEGGDLFSRTAEVTPKPYSGPGYAGSRFSSYNNNTDVINAVDDPDQYNAWLVEYLKTPTPTPVPTATPVPTPTPAPTPEIGLTGADLAAARSKNSDFVAWITIPGTNVDYPIVATNNISYYLNHTFEGRRSDLGTLFSLGKSDWRRPAKNIAIYGHDVEGSGKKMFKKLLDYKDPGFYADHAYIYLDSVYRTGVYQIFAVFDITQGDYDPSTSTFASNAEFMAFVNRGKQLSRYNTNVNVSPNSTIITLITCDRYFKRKVGRFVVMAVKIK